MEMTPRFLTALTASCVLAAAAGGYFAVRQNAAPAAVPLASSFSPVEILTDEPSSPPKQAQEVAGSSAVKEPTENLKAEVRKSVSSPARAVAPKVSSDAEKPISPRRSTTSRQLETVLVQSAGIEPDTTIPPQRSDVSATSPRVDGHSADTANTTRSGETGPAADDLSTQAQLPPSGMPPTSGEPSRGIADGSPLVPQAELEQVTVPRDSVVGVQFETTVSSETAALEDTVEARVTREVRAGGRVAIPAGSRMLGTVTLVDRGGRFKERARIAVRFHTLVLPDGTRESAPTDTIFREGSSPTNESAAKVGGAAVGGAILGAILGGGRGAAIGGSIGAAGGTAAVMAGERNAAILAAGATVTVRLQAPVTVTLDR